MAPRTGILVINLGTPDAADKASVHRYLKEFLSDPRVIEKQGLIWWFVLNRIILPKRARSSSRAYGQIWNTNLDESPLKTITRAQSDRLADHFADDPAIVVDWAMRYGNPSIKNAIARLTKQGCTRILFFPLYPQYSSATTGSVMDKVFDCLGDMRWQPEIRTVPPYFTNTAYIDALAHSVTAHVASLGWQPEVTMMSFHGLPQAFIQNGDPYQDQCQQTADLLRAALGRDLAQMPLVYQSRGGGKAVWIGPELEGTLAELAQNGIKNLCVITPGFASDCIETLEEVQIRAAQVFRDHGGQNFSLVPCLNDSDRSITMLADLATTQLGGWL